MKILTYLKKCETCSVEYLGSNPSRYCLNCKEIHKLESQRRRTYAYQLRNSLIKNPGVGKGGANLGGTLDSQYKTGISLFRKIGKKIKAEIRYCERCSKDLSNVNNYSWVIHHIDHDSTNNVESNFELLCKSCHQIEHKCYLSFSKRAETIS